VKTEAQRPAGREGRVPLPAKEIAPHAALSLLTLATFARGVPYPLQGSWDDGRFIVDNRDVHEVSWRSLQSIFGAPHFQAYHPLHLLSYWLDVPWVGANAVVLHATSLLLWLVAANLVLLALMQLGCSASAALIAAAVCALHPVQVEAVSWATGRKDVLAMTFSCSCILLHARSERASDRCAWLERLAYVFAVLSKTTALPLPAVLVLADVTLRKRPLRQALAREVPSLLLGAGLSVYVVLLWQQEQMIRPSSGWLGRVVATFGHQLGTALWPSSTSPMYSTEAVALVSGSAVLASVALLVAGSLAVSGGAGRAVFSLGAFTLLMLPVSNAIAMYFPYQDRYLSLPLLGLCFGLAAALDAVPTRARRAALSLGAALVVVLGLRCWQYQGEWQSEVRLWGHAASTQTDAYYALMKLGEVRRRAGDLYGAIRAYQHLLQLDPKRTMGHAALLQAVALRDEKLRRLAPSQAERYAREYYDALEDPEALRELAAHLLQAGYLRTTELPLAKAFALQPVSDAVLEHAADVQFAEGRPSLGLFYLGQMRRATQRADLRGLAEGARRQLAAAPVL
jgi:tetratricopeptide (TPR) repeat protein